MMIAPTHKISLAVKLPSGSFLVSFMLKYTTGKSFGKLFPVFLFLADLESLSAHAEFGDTLDGDHAELCSDVSITNESTV